MKNKILLLISIIIITIFFIYPLFLNKFYSFRDTFLYVIPLKHFTMEYIKNGRIPWYNPYNGGGEYFLTNPQINLFYPLSYLFLLPPQIGFQFYQLFQILLCFIGVYLLSKSYGKDEILSTSYGFSIIFSGLFLSLWDLPFEMGCISFLFLTLWALKEKNFSFFILFLSLMFFSGEPFSFLFSFLFIIFFIRIEKIEFKKILKPIFLFLFFSSGIIFLALAIIPFTTRTEKSSLIFEGLNYKKIISISGGTASFYNSNEYSYLPVLFFGTFLFGNFLYGAFSRNIKRIYLLPFFFFFILSMGNYGILKFFFNFPPFSFLRYPDRFLPLCLAPALLLAFERKEKNIFAFLFHFILIFLSFIFFTPKSIIFFIPIISLLILFFLYKRSKILIFLPFLDLILSLPLFTTQKFTIPELPFNLKENPMVRVFIPEKNIKYLKYLYPNNYFTKESDLKGVLLLDSYANLFYPISTNYTPHPFPLKILRDFSSDVDFILSCQYFGTIEEGGIIWQKIKSNPLFEPEVNNLKIKGDGFEFKVKSDKDKKMIIRFLNLKYTKVLLDGIMAKIDENEKWIKFDLKSGSHNIRISFTPLILKILYILSFIAWISFLCYFIIRWIMSLF